MYSFPVSLLFPVKHGVLVFGQHLGLGGHRFLPCIEGLQRLTLLGKRLVYCRHDRIDGL